MDVRVHPVLRSWATLNDPSVNGICFTRSPVSPGDPIVSIDRSMSGALSFVKSGMGSLTPSLRQDRYITASYMAH
jgi:hypothetical protein